MVEGKKLKIPIRAAESIDEEAKFLMSVGDLKKLMDEKAAFTLIDVRNENEFKIVRIDGAKLATRDLVEEIFEKWDKTSRIVICDHVGKESINATKALHGRGFTETRSLAGGIDAWSQAIDPLLPRY
ncbi:MAG: hypothetical protein COB53_09405 [Elusimicrobia bacterium]|nr:MAG: hypothetical protein COB53_09405 [Elusimicrobiota bacterium]